jgi:predicted oxidoreductase
MMTDKNNGGGATETYECDALVGGTGAAGLKLVIGDLGTYASIKTDAHARALDADGRVIGGLCAAGQ